MKAGCGRVAWGVLTVGVILNWGAIAGGCPAGDLTGDCRVDHFDLAVFANQWLDGPGCSGAGCADLEGEDGVDLRDFAVLAGGWRVTERETTVAINEFMADNDDFILDPAGDYDDWVEIHNYGPNPVDIGGMYLTDDLSEPGKWRLPTDRAELTTIDSGGYLLIWADEEMGEAGLHADFKLSADREDVGLFDIDGVSRIDGVSFGPQQGDTSYGRYPDGGGDWRVFSAAGGAAPTPGSGNQAQAARIVINEIMYHPYHGEFEAEPNGREYIELCNTSAENVDLTGWRLTDGVDFNFPAGTNLGGGQYLVVAADVNVFGAAYPAVTNVVGGWDGKLTNGGERIVLTDAGGTLVDSVEYADEGDWARRELGPVDLTHRGWEWSEAHDGDGNSLELVNALMPNEWGQNWAASMNGGTPGAVNGRASADIAPIVIDARHFPYIPHSTETVAVSARVMDELESGVSVLLRWRIDGEANFSSATMYDDGVHGDGVAGDGVYGVGLGVEPNGTVVEFYIEARDAGANLRTWPAASNVDGVMRQATNALYMVDDSFEPVWFAGRQPVYYMVMTGAEFAELQDIGDEEWDEGNDIREYRTMAQMNATFISVDGTDMKVRYCTGVRNRGQGTRHRPPMNYRVNLRHDEPWEDLTELNFNSQYTYLQQVGSQIFRLAGLPAAESAAVQIRVNGRNLAMDTDRMYGSYVRLEVINEEFAKERFYGDGDGNVYKCDPLGYSASLEYLGTDPRDYNEAGYYKQSNEAASDWNDLFELTNVLQYEPNATYVGRVRQVADVNQWLTWFAVHSLIDNNETNLGNGFGDDYYLYSGRADERFVLIPHDLDTILGMGDEPVTTNWSIFRAADEWYLRNTIRRFLRQPVFAWRYYEILENLIGTVFEPNSVATLFANSAGDYVPGATIAQIRNHVATRNAQVLAQLSGIARVLTVHSGLAVVNGYHRTTSSSTSLDGVANPLYTRSVFVNGQRANWSDNDDKWSTASAATLRPGINRIIVQTFDDANATGAELERAFIDIWYDYGGESTLSGTIAAPGMMLDAASGPWHVNGDVIVPAGVTLTIEAGATVFFDAGRGITVNGRLVAEGSQYQRIRLTKVPGGASNWDGVAFVNSLNDSRLGFVDMEYGDVQGASIRIDHSQVEISRTTWAGTDITILNLNHPSLLVADSIFPAISGAETILGQYIEGAEYLILKGNTFGRVSDGNTAGNADVMDFLGAESPGPVVQVIDNVFLGGADDGLDLDGTDAYIEGNIFMNFHLATTRPTTSNAVATGLPQSGEDNRTDITVVRNVFFNCDHGILLKEEAFATVLNNVFVDMSLGAIQFTEEGGTSVLGPGKGAYIEGSIFWDNNDTFGHYDSNTQLVINDSMLPAQWHSFGQGNIEADPVFVNEGGDFHLAPDSPGVGSGPNGSDMGAYVAAGASVSGEPYPITWRTTATLTVGGADIAGYVYRVKDNGVYGGWSAVTDVNVPIALSSLVSGHSYTVYVRARNSLGQWPGDPNGNASRSWSVDTGWSRVTISEILAHTHGAEPDVVELHYDGAGAINLAGMSLTDDPCEPRKFVFGSMVMNPGDYRVLWGDSEPGSDHIGFALSSYGEGLYLYDTAARGGGLVDSVEFGPQINDCTIARFAGDEWGLAYPTFGAANVRRPLGNAKKLKINEWFADGQSVLQDDFIEVYNPCPLPVSLGGLYLTDDCVRRPDKHRIADLSFVDPCGYTVFIADDERAKGPVHLDFKLGVEGEMLGLFGADMKAIDKVIYGPQTTDASQGRSPDGSDYYAFFAAPTPEGANPEMPHPELPPPIFDSASSGQTGSSSTLTWSHTVGGEANRLLVVGTQGEVTSASKANLTVQSVTYNGVPLTKAGSEIIDTGYAMRAEMWYLPDANLPGAGSYNIVVTCAGNADNLTGGAVSINGAVQGAPEDVATSTSTSGSISAAVSATAGAWVFDSVGCGNSSDFSTVTPGMAERYEADAASSTGAGSTKAAVTTDIVAMEWSNSNANRMAQVVASFRMLP